MSMTWTYAKLYVSTLVVFLVLDFAWLGIVARGFYRDRLSPLMRSDVLWPAAGAFYLLFVAALIVFVVVPSLERESLARAATFGAFFGLVTYATYDLTNLAVMRDFPGVVAFVDMAWGTILGSGVATVSHWIGRGLG